MSAITSHDAGSAFADLPARDAAGHPVRLTMLTRAGCHLCQVAQATLEQVGREQQVAWVAADLDMVGTDDPELLRRYGDLVPVIFVDGKEVAHFRVSGEQLRAAMRPPPRQRLWEMLHKRLR